MEDINKNSYEKHKKYILKYQKKKYDEDPDFKERVLSKLKENYKNKYNNDPLYREKVSQRNRENYIKVKEGLKKLKLLEQIIKTN